MYNFQVSPPLKHKWFLKCWSLLQSCQSQPFNPSPVTLPPNLHNFIFQSTSATVTTSSSSLPPPLRYDLIHSNFLSLSPRSHTISHSITSTPLSSISSNSLHFLQQPGNEEGASRKISDASIHSEPLLEWECSNSISFQSLQNRTSSNNSCLASQTLMQLFLIS